MRFFKWRCKPQPWRILAFAILLLVANESRISAAVVLCEQFQYANGDLMGLHGGVGYDGSKWTSAWYGASADQFLVVAEAIQSGWSGAPIESALRSFTSTVTPGATMYFSTVMNQYGNEGNYEFDWGFSEINVGLSMFNDEWRLKLGSTEVTTSGASVAAATDFRVIGRLEFNASGDDDRLTMWIAPTTGSITESDPHILQLAADCGQDTLGGIFRLRRLGGCDSAKQWSDICIATDFASVAANTSMAASYLEDSFAYANGGLHGQNGGNAVGGASWVTAWADADYGVGTDRNGVVKDFYVESEVAGMTQSGGSIRTISRQFDTGTEDGTTMYFSAIMGKPDTEAEYEIACRFGDSDASLERIATIGIANDQYRIRLGDTMVTAPDKTIAQHQYERLVGRLEFNADGTAERLSFWANPTFESDVPALECTADLAALSLGNLVDLWYGPGADGAKHWDDLRIGTDFQAATRLRVDIGPNGQMVESGFQAWDTGAVGLNGVDVSKSFVQLGGFTARLEGDPTGGVDLRDRGSEGGLLDDLKRDGVKTGSFRLYFDDLAEGLYELTTYHHDSLDPIGGGMVDIFVNDAETPVVTLGQTGDALTPASTVFQFYTDSSGSAYFRFVGGETWLNGFELTAISAVPEPSTLGLLVLALACVVVSRRRFQAG